MPRDDNLDADYYAILGIQIGASDAQINAAYKQMISEWHPDRHRNKPPTMRNYAGAMAAMLNEAREVLTNPRRRAAYDAEYRRQKGRETYTGDQGTSQGDSDSQHSGQRGSDHAQGNEGNRERSDQNSKSEENTSQQTRKSQTRARQSKSEATFRAGQKVYEGATEQAGRGVGKTIVIIVLALVALAVAAAAIYGITMVAITAVTAIFDFLTSAVQAFFNFLTTLLTYLVALAIVGGFLFAMYKMRQ